MKRFLSLIFTVTVCCIAAFAAGYTVDRIPSVHLADSTRFVSNPDGVLSPAAEAQLNEMLRALTRSTSAEVVCVVVNDIDEASDIDDFATELFRAWGVGKKDKNNGLLLLIAKDRRKYAFRTGNGLEGLLPDGLLGSIGRQVMKPHFLEGDYDGGTIEALGDISKILSSPEAREEVMSKYKNNVQAKDGPEPFDVYLCLCAILAAVCLAWVLSVAWRTGKLSRYERYKAADKLFVPMLVCTFLGLGIPVIAFAIVAVWRHDLRRGKHLCANCGKRMNLIDEERDNDYLERSQDIEERLGAVDYDVWLCPACGETDIIPYIQNQSGYSECPVCHARTLHVISDRTTVYPTVERPGLREEHLRCEHCGFDDIRKHQLPQKAQSVPIIILPPGGGGGGSFGGGGFGGGSFGGGSTSGGGASGGW